MRTDLISLYTQLEQLSHEELIASFRKTLEAYDETLSLQKEQERSFHEMALQFSEMKSRLAGYEKENIRLKEENVKLTEQLHLRKKDLFGRTTESSSAIIKAALEDEISEDPLSEEPSVPESQPSSVSTGDIPALQNRCRKTRSGRKAGKRKEDLSRLPVRTEFQLNIEELDAEYGAGNWRIYNWTRHARLASVPSSKYLQVTYTPVLSIGLEHCMKRIALEGDLLPGSLVSPSILAEIIYNKFVLGLPLYRQEQDLARNDVILSRQTMVNWITRFSLDLFGPVYDHMTQLLRLSRYNQCDETVLEVIQDGGRPGSKSYMWVHTTSELFGGNPIAVFCYELTRSTQHLRDFYLENGYQGFLASDAYVSYGVLEKESDGDITGSGCFMHCRRRFVNAILVAQINKMKPEEVNELPEIRAQLLLDEIYQAETPLKGIPAEERRERRTTEVRPKVDAFFAYLHSLETEPDTLGERMQDAIRYALNQESRLREFLNDPMIPCDNGYVERVIRSTMAIGRNNWLFSYSITGAEVMAIIYTLTETAKLNHVHPYYYLQYLLEKMPGNMERTDRGFLSDMMPWSDAYKEYEAETRQQNLKHLTDQAEPCPPKTPRKRDRNKASPAA